MKPPPTDEARQNQLQCCKAVVQKYGIIIGVAGKGNWAKMAEEVELEKKKVYAKPFATKEDA